MRFFEATLMNKSTGREQSYLLKAKSEGDVADYLIGEGGSYCGQGNFSYDFKETSKNNRKFKEI